MASYDLTGDDYVIERTEGGQTIYHIMGQAQDDESLPLAVAMAVATEVAPIHATVAPDARGNNRRRGRAEEDSDTDYDSDAPLRQRFRFVSPADPREEEARQVIQRFVDDNRMAPNYAATPGPTLHHTMALVDSDGEPEEEYDFDTAIAWMPSHRAGDTVPEAAPAA